jgi:hypothetical protein
MRGPGNREIFGYKIGRRSLLGDWATLATVAVSQK